jgi:hypothetical protein
MKWTVPNIQNAGFTQFCDFIRKSAVRPAAGLSPSTHQNHLEVIHVPVIPQPGAMLGSCWFNCLEHMLANGGEVVYGWALWHREAAYLGQHHAVWRGGQGQLLDPTPNVVGDKHIIFMPDNRAPFDIEKLRSPFSVSWSSDSQWAWVAADGTQVREFYIAAMEPTPAQRARIERIRQELKLRK